MSNKQLKEDKQNLRTRDGFTIRDIWLKVLADYCRKQGDNFFAELLEKEIGKK